MARNGRRWQEITRNGQEMARNLSKACRDRSRAQVLSRKSLCFWNVGKIVLWLTSYWQIVLWLTTCWHIVLWLTNIDKSYSGWQHIDKSYCGWQHIDKYLLTFQPRCSNSKLIKSQQQQTVTDRAPPHPDQCCLLHNTVCYCREEPQIAVRQQCHSAVSLCNAAGWSQMFCYQWDVMLVER